MTVADCCVSGVCDYHNARNIRRDEALREKASAIAQEFHETYEKLAPVFGYKTRDESAVPWDQVPANNRVLMIATVQALLDGETIQPGGMCARCERARTETDICPWDDCPGKRAR